MVYFAELKGVARKEAGKRALEFLERVGLQAFAKQKIKNLSSGQQQKIQLGITIINRPELLILDEPTKGLDPVNRQLLVDLLIEEQKRGATILFSSHYMEEVEQLADSLLILKQGQKKVYGKLDEVKSNFGKNTIHLHFEGSLPKSSMYHTVNQKRYNAELMPNNDANPEEILEFLVKQGGIKVKEFRLDTPSLEEIFLSVEKGVI
jgi:ABC-2 type transport system ATP-binding protein